VEQNNRVPAPVKVLNILTIVLDVLLIILLSAVKADYYISDNKLSGGIDFYDVLWICWIPLSFLITLSPMITQVIILLFVRFKKQLFALLFPFFTLCGDLGFEVVSMIGGTMTLDGEWMDTAVLIAECLLLFNVPLILSLAALIVNGAFLRKEKREKADI
jgi:hypothetical protein